MNTDSLAAPALAPTAHHPLGPSQWPMIAECADFEAPPEVIEAIDETAGEEPEEDTSAKGRGRVKHEAVAMLLTGDLATKQRALSLLTSEREVAEVQFVVERAVQILQENGYTVADLRVEQRVTMLKPDTFEPLYFGTGDGEAGPLDFDWKFGEERNYFPQLVGYALPKMEARGETLRYGYVIYGRLRKSVRYVLERKTVETVAYGLLSRRLAPTRKPTPCQYCGWCRKVATCSALVAEPVALVARREDWSLKLPSPHVSQLNDPTWIGAARFVWKRYLEPWGKAVEYQSSLMASGNITPAGFKIRPEKGRRSITSAQKAFTVLAKLIPEDALWDCFDTSLGALAKAHAKVSGISEEKAENAVVTALIDAHALTTGEPSRKLIVEKDAENIIRTALASSPLAIARPE